MIKSNSVSQFTSSLFEEYGTNRAFEHIRPFPYHLQSIAQAKRFVNMLKGVLLLQGQTYFQQSCDYPTS